MKKPTIKWKDVVTKFIQIRNCLIGLTRDFTFVSSIVNRSRSDHDLRNVHRLDNIGFHVDSYDKQHEPPEEDNGAI